MLRQTTSTVGAGSPNSAASLLVWSKCHVLERSWKMKSIKCSSMRSKAMLATVTCVSLVFVAARSSAAPITLQFEATVTTVATGFPFESGIHFAEGDVISGVFAFEPNGGTGGMNLNTIQPYTFSLQINGKILAVPNFEIRSSNDTPIEDVPSASTIDSLVLGASGLSPQSPGINISPNFSGFRITLFGAANTFDSAKIPDDLSVWNSFDVWRDISVSVRDGSGGAIGFQATIGNFQVVPEPSAIVILTFSILKLFGRARHS